MKRRVATAVSVLALLGACATAFPATAAASNDAAVVQGLVSQIEAALNRVGCTATTEQDILAIEEVIVASGATPVQAEEALKEARVHVTVCGSQGSALSRVDNTIVVALSRSDPSGGPGGGLAFGGPIGAPAVFVGTEGPDYTP